MSPISFGLSMPRCVREMGEADRAVLDAFAEVLAELPAGRGRTLVRSTLLRAREEVRQELMTWDDRGTAPDVEAWHRAVERQVAAEVAATERLRHAARRRPNPKPRRAAPRAQPAGPLPTTAAMAEALMKARAERQFASKPPWRPVMSLGLRA